MFNLVEFLKKIFSPKNAASELVDNLKNNSELTNDQTHMLGNLLKLGNIQIRDIMVPRADIVSIDIDSNFEMTLKLFIEAAHSRLPIYKDQLDNIVGMLHVKDLLPYWQKKVVIEQFIFLVPAWRMQVMGYQILHLLREITF